jgi:hypothetical protein
LRKGEKLCCGSGCGDGILLIGFLSNYSTKELHHISLAALAAHSIVSAACVATDFEGIATSQLQHIAAYGEKVVDNCLFYFGVL